MKTNGLESKLLKDNDLVRDSALWRADRSREFFFQSRAARAVERPGRCGSGWFLFSIYAYRASVEIGGK
jgi:hypothetical protein